MSRSEMKKVDSKDFIGQEENFCRQVREKEDLGAEKRKKKEIDR